MKAIAPGKIILFGEHAVVYGKLGIAGAIGMYTTCEARESDAFVMTIPSRDFEWSLTQDQIKDVCDKADARIKSKKFAEISRMVKDRWFNCVAYVLGKMAEDHNISPVKVSIESELHKGMGGSASFFASVAQSVSDLYSLGLTKKEISDLAYKGDVISHAGMPSGIDNSTVTFGGYIKFRKDEGPKPIDIRNQIPLVIGDTGVKSGTGEMVLKSREAHNRDKLIDDIDKIAMQAMDAIKSNDLVTLGELMNKNQELLRLLNVSSPNRGKLIKTAKFLELSFNGFS